MIRRAIPLNHGGLSVHLALGVVFFVMLLLLPARAATPVVRVSVASNGTQANGPSFGQAISADGRYVAFTSTATNLVAGDTNGQSDIFVHDTVLHTTSRALLAGGAARNVEDVFVGDVSADGRLVCFVSAAAGLVAGDTNAVFDAFVYDFSTQQTTRVSVASDGTQGNATSSGTPRMSADGRFIVFQSEATNFAPLSNGNFNDIFVHDRVTHQTTQISTGVNGTAPNGFSVFAQISATGRFVTFSSIATNLTAQPDTNGSIRDIYVHDRQTGVTERASVGPGGVQGNADSITGAISADGRFLAYESSASNLVANDTNALDDIFLLDRQSRQTVRISVSDTGIQGNDSSSYVNLCISANGRFIAFIANATNLVPGAPAGTYLYDRALRHIQSASSVGAGFLSGDGRAFAFGSFLSNLVAGDTNGAFDVFVTDLTSLEPSLPAFALDRGALQFGATDTGAAFVQQTPAQTVRLSQTGSGSAAWSATPTQPWITVSPASGTGPAVLTIGVQFAPGLPLSGTSSGR